MELAKVHNLQLNLVIKLLMMLTCLTSFDVRAGDGAREQILSTFNSRNCGEPLKRKKLEEAQKVVAGWKHQGKEFLLEHGLTENPSILMRFLPKVTEPDCRSGNSRVDRNLETLKQAIQNLDSSDRSAFLSITTKMLNLVKLASEIENSISDRLESSDTHSSILACDASGKIVALGLVNASRDGSNLVVEYLMSSPDPESKGSGTAALLEILRSRTFHGEEIELKATQGSEGFYESLGFTPCAHDIGYYCLSQRKARTLYPKLFH